MNSGYGTSPPVRWQRSGSWPEMRSYFAPTRGGYRSSFFTPRLWLPASQASAETIHATPGSGVRSPDWRRSEEHTSELQSLAYLVCRLLLEKKKNTDNNTITRQPILADMTD